MDTLKGDLAADTLALVVSRPVLHAASALAELSPAIGLLRLGNARTEAALRPIRDTLSRISPLRAAPPAPRLWVEAAVLAGILTRTQGIPHADRRKLLTDALLFLQVEDTGAILLTCHLRDFDPLLQDKPGPGVLFYDRRA